MTPNSWETPDGAIALGYAAHLKSLRGVVRQALVHRALIRHLTQPTRVLDIGGGTATQARLLARAGHHVTVVDPDPEMHAQARTEIAGEAPDVQARIELVHGRGEDAVNLVGDGWPAVCCHGVLMYLDDPAELLNQLVTATLPGGLISILTKNAAAIPLRPALEGRWADALALLDADREIGNLGTTSRGHHLNDLAAQLADLGAPVESWRGVRVATDHLRDTPADEQIDDVTGPGDRNRDLVVNLEWELGGRDPYRAVARLLHLICRRDPITAP